MKTLFTILFLHCFFAAFAQKIHFTDTSNVWKEIQPQYDFPGPTLYYYHTYNFIGDTIIGSHSYKQFNFLYNHACGCISRLREDTVLKKVYIWNEVADSETVLMDYNLHIGDTFNTPHNRFAVVKIDSTLINGVWHRVWCFPPLRAAVYMGDTIRVIEGIGCIQHPTYMLWDFSGCVECMQPSVYCFSNRGITPPLSPAISSLDNSTSCTYYPTLSEKAILWKENQIKAYPNPATNELTIKMSNAQPVTVSLINMLGQTVKTVNSDKQEVTIAVDKIPAGVYTVMLTNGNGERINTKAVINH